MLFVSFICIIFLRAPSLFIEPRFWAEEGSVYISYAYAHSWYESLLVTHLGYYSLFNNLIASIATKLVPLIYAPFVTTFAAFIVQIIPFLIILWGDSICWDNIYKRIIVSLFILFVSSTGEIWLNTINSQFYFSLIAFLILMERKENHGLAKKISYRILLLFSGLTGVVSVFLTPLYVLKAYRTRDREHLIQSIIMFIAATVQFMVFVFLLFQRNLESRFIGTDFFYFIANFVYYNLIVPILGYYFDLGVKVRAIIRILLNQELNSNNIIWINLIIVLLIFIYFMKFFYENVKSKDKVYIIGGYFLISILSMISSVKTLGGPRYSYVPGVIIVIFIMMNIEFGKNLMKSFHSLAALIVISVALAIGIAEYKSRMTNFVDNRWPKWREEILSWEKEENYSLRIWPQWEKKNWTMKLNKQK